MPDISDQMSMATSTPQEASDHITGGKMFDMGADVFKDMKPELQPDIEKFRKPAEATPAVSSYVSQSTEHAALAAPDVPALSFMETKARALADVLSPGSSNSQEITRLTLKKMDNPGKFSEMEEMQLFQLNEKAQSYQQEFEQKSLIGKGVSILGSFSAEAIQSASKHADLIAASSTLMAGAAALNSAPAAALSGFGAPLVVGGAAVAGGLTGFIGATGIAMLADSFDSTTAQTYNDLSNTKKADGSDMNIDEDTKKRLAVGVGLTTTAINAVVGKYVAGNTPFLKDIGRSIVLDPAKAALRQAMFNVGRAAAVGGAGGGSNEAIKVLSEEFAQHYDGSEASYVNAIINASGRIGGAAGTGALVAGAGAAVGEVAGFKKTKASMIAEEESKFANAKPTGPRDDNMIGSGDRGPRLPDDGGPAPAGAPPLLKAPTDIIPTGLNAADEAALNAATPYSKAVQVLEFDDAMTQISKASQATEMKNLSPGELAQIEKTILDQHNIKSVHIDKEDLQKFASNDKKALAVRNIIDPTGVAAGSMNAPIEIPAHEFLQLVHQYPEASELAKLTPEGPNAQQGRKFLEGLIAAHGQREEVLKKLGSKDISPEDRALVEQYQEPVIANHDVTNEDQYLDQTKLAAAMKDLVPAGEFDKYLKAQGAAKQSVVDNINESALYEMNAVRDVVADNAREVEVEAQTARLENNPNLQIVDRFTKTFEMTPDNRFNNIADMTANHAKPGYSPLAIDPRTLTEAQKSEFLADERLKAAKVFVKGGISADDSARLVGVNGGDNLLRILANTPSRDEVIAGRVAAREADIQRLATESVNLDETSLIKAYQADIANALETMKYMKAKEWPTMRGGIKRIALEPPKIAEINYLSRTAVAAMKVGKLNANTYKVGQRKSHRMAVDAILANKPEEAFTAQKNVAMNIAMAKETHLAIGKVNRVIKFAKRFNKKDVMQELKDAGPMYEKAVNEILDVFNLNPSKKGLAEAGDFQKWAKKMAAEGESTFEIPDRLADVRQSVNEMTVEQTLVVGDRLKNILHMAKTKNKLYTKHEGLRYAREVEFIAEELNDVAKTNFDYDETKNLVVQKDSRSRIEKAGEFFHDIQNSLERPQHLLLKLDNGNINGPWNKYFYRPIADGHSAEKALGIQTIKQLETIIDDFGKEEFNAMATKVYAVPEFKAISSLKGKVTEQQLWMMNLNRGNDGNLEALERFGVSQEIINEVLDRHLTEKHMVLTQRIWDMFKSFEPKIKELTEVTEGTEVKFVEAKPVVFKGKTYPGGYFPLHYVADPRKIKAQELVGSVEKSKLDRFKQKMFAQAQTEQGHLENRYGSKAVLDLDVNRIGHSLAQVGHDLSMRIPIRDTAKLLADEKISKAMVSVIGNQGYDNISDMIIASANSVQEYNKATGWVQSMMNYLGSGTSIVDIGGKWTSMIIQPVSTLFAIEKMGGVQGTKYMTKTLAKFAANPHLMRHFYEFAAELHAPIRDNREDLEGDVVHGIMNVFPKKRIKAIRPITAAQEFIINKAFGALGSVDQFNKVLVVSSAYSQAINGDAPGIPGGDHEAAKTYASNIAELTQTHSNVRNQSPIQRMKYIKPAIMFWNDANNVLNSIIGAGRKFRGNFKSSKQKFQNGDFTGGAKDAAIGIGSVMSMMTILSVATYYENLLHGQPNAFDDPESTKSPENFAKAVGKFYFGNSFNAMIGTIPGVRDIDYTIGKHWEKRKNVETPMGKMVNDFATATSGLGHMLGMMSDGQDVSPQEAKAIWYATGYLAHLPADAIYKYMGKPDLTETPLIMKNAYSETSMQIEKFIKKNDGAKNKVSDDFVNDLKNIQEQLKAGEGAQGASNEVPAGTMDIIKQIESKGKWNAQNPNSSAAGLYQFTEGKWKDIMDRAPDLGLTENGRISSNTEQQEKAAEWVAKDSIKALKKADIPVTTETIYAAHFLGNRGAISVYSAPADEKLKTLVGEKVVAANGFTGSTTVKAFRTWIENKTFEAQMQIETRQASVDKPGN